MKLDHYSGLEVNLVQEDELDQTIIDSLDLPYPQEGSIFSILEPDDWLSAGRELREAIIKEDHIHLSKLGSAYFLDVLEYCGEDYSEVEVEKEQSESLKRFLNSRLLLNYFSSLGLENGFSGKYHFIKSSNPYIFLYIRHEQLINLNIADLPSMTIEDELNSILDENEDKYWHKRWLEELIDSVRSAIEEARGNNTRPGLFIYPSIYPEGVFELYEDESPLIEVNKAIDFIRKVERNQKPGFNKDLSPFLNLILKKYLEVRIQNLKEAVDLLDTNTLGNIVIPDWFPEDIDMSEFAGQPRKFLFFLLKKLNP